VRPVPLTGQAIGYAGHDLPEGLGRAMRLQDMREIGVAEADSATSVAAGQSPDSPALRRGRRAAFVALALTCLVVTAYGAFERVSTSANADKIELTRNLAGGFMAMGMTERSPGFVLLSLLDRDVVDVSADQASTLAAGTRTNVSVRTSKEVWRKRLRSPQVILVGHDGSVKSFGVDWTYQDFRRLRERADCSDHSGKRRGRCGAPFAGLHEAVATGAVDHVPDGVRAFLSRFKDHVH